jgi:hypothetical protein
MIQRAARAEFGLRMGPMDRCPRCGSPRVHASRLRSPLEHARAALTGQAPVRCHACNYRLWTADPPVTVAVKDDDVGAAGEKTDSTKGLPVTTDELDRLDPA